jgi:hypothetical protein
VVTLSRVEATQRVNTRNIANPSGPNPCATPSLPRASQGSVGRLITTHVASTNFAERRSRQLAPEIESPRHFIRCQALPAEATQISQSRRYFSWETMLSSTRSSGATGSPHQSRHLLMPSQPTLIGTRGRPERQPGSDLLPRAYLERRERGVSRRREAKQAFAGVASDSAPGANGMRRLRSIHDEPFGCRGTASTSSGLINLMVPSRSTRLLNLTQPSRRLNWWTETKPAPSSGRHAVPATYCSHHSGMRRSAW